MKAKEIYYNDYWLACGCDKVRSYEVASELFDTGVNMGVGVARRFFQEALNLLNRNGKNYPDLVVDGILGSKTLSAYNSVDELTFLKVLNGLQFMRYVEICRRNPSQEKYFNGWMKRV